jgi:hypothetical protein
MAAVLDLEIAEQAGPAAFEQRGARTHRSDLQENPRWGSERIRGELLKLGIAVSNRSIRRYRWAPQSIGGSPALAYILDQSAPGHLGR